MPAKLQKYPVYVYDEPATYDSFTGGINTDPSNEHLAENELRSCINMTYKSGALVTRNGASKLCTFDCEDELFFVQGVFLFTHKTTHLIVAADGKLYSGVYAKDVRVSLTRITIPVNAVSDYYVFDPSDLRAGLPVYSLEISNTKTDGYVYAHTDESIELIFQNYRKIEAATYENKLYVATGTRFIAVSSVNGHLQAEIVSAHRCSGSEIQAIGWNYMTPYPEFCQTSTTDATITAATALLAIPLVTTTTTKQFTLQPVMSFAQGDSIPAYFYRWEKFKDNQWVTIVSFKDNHPEGSEKINYFSINVTDADTYVYRVKFAKQFMVDIDPETQAETTREEDITRYFEATNTTADDVDWVTDTTVLYNGSVASVLYDSTYGISDKYATIQSCVKILGDGNKFILYDDRFNSGSWFKTIIDNPGYITDRGSLSFKTNKNEAVIKAIQFSGNIVVFAHSDNVGGSIHLVTGAGDDYEGDEYYSPYRRKTVNANVSCNNADTVQVCENLLLFKYFDTLYYITGSELTSDVISLYSINDRVKKRSPDVYIPWDDNDCISEVTEDYYALLWKEKYTMEENNLVQLHPAMRVKFYYKLVQTIKDANRVYFPCLLDVGECFNTDFILTINGTSAHVVNNAILSFAIDIYTDLGAAFDFSIKFRGVDLNYPKILKLVQSVIVYYHHDHKAALTLNFVLKNEASHTLIDSRSKRATLQDLKSLVVGSTLEDGSTHLDTSIMNSQVYNADYGFPALLAEAEITGQSTGEVSISSLTYNYTTIETPDTTQYDLYSSIIRKKETA